MDYKKKTTATTTENDFFLFHKRGSNAYIVSFKWLQQFHGIKCYYKVPLLLRNSLLLLYIK